MKSWKKPTPEQVETVVAQLAHGEHQRYFFDRLENPEWLVPLRDKRFFKSPPLPVPDESGATVALPVWPESRYLARMAKLAPQTVWDIIASIPDTENARVHDDLVEAALAMPAKLAANIVSKAIRWIRSPFKLLLPEKLGALLSHLAVGGEVESALQLANALLQVKADPIREQKIAEENEFLRPKPQPFFELWYYRQILEKNVPDLVTVTGVRALALLCDVLNEAVRLSQSDAENRGPDDYSYIWRPSIKHPRNTVDDATGLLVSAVRGAAQQLGEQNPTRIPEIIQHLETRNWRIFHRIALDVLRAFVRVVPDLVADRLREPARFDRMDFYREYNLLAKEGFAQLARRDQEIILDWIQRGPDIESFTAGWQSFYGEPVTDAEAARYSKVWQRDRLAPFSAYLPEEWKQRYADLVGEVGPARDAEYAAESMWGGSSSPKSAEDLGSMTIDQLIEFLRSWIPSGDPLGNSIAGLGNAVRALVASEPERFSGEAERFKGLDPTYVRALLQALWEPAKEKRALRWEKILTLCHWVVNQPREIPGRKGSLMDQDPNWGWTRKAIANLLLAGFGSDGIPFELRRRAWEVLEPLTVDPHPTAENESRSSQSHDPAEYSINTTRGEAMHATVGYALWVRRGIERGPDGKDRAAEGFDQMSEVRAVLDKHLDPGHEPSRAIRAVYGQWFPWLHLLDPKWARASIPKIFPSEEAFKDLRDAAWKTYIVYCPPFNDTFAALQEQYRQAIERIKTSSDEPTGRRAPDVRLAQHLMTQYWRGQLQEDDQEGLLTHFYAKADPELRYRALEFIGMSLRNTQEVVPEEVLDRLKKLWSKRLEAARGTRRPSLEGREITAFGWWFASKRFPDLWSIDQVSEVLRIAGSIQADHLMIERLAELSELAPAKAVECLVMIIEADKDGWGILSWREHVRTLLSAAIRADDQTARVSAIGLIHRLGARGYPDFRDLLPANSRTFPG